MSPNYSDPRRQDKIHRYKPFLGGKVAPGIEDSMSDYANIVAMLTSMIALMFKFKWCAWIALYGSSVSFANCKENDDQKQMFSSFMLSISAIIMCYVQDPRPLTFPWMIPL